MQNVTNYSAGGGVPIGTIISFMGTIPPADYLKCDGATYNIEDYPDLADFFEVQFGSKNKFGGDGITTFKVPDLRGEFLRCTGTNSHSNSGNGGNVGVHQDATAHVRTEFAVDGTIWVSGKSTNRQSYNRDSEYDLHSDTGRNFYGQTGTDAYTAVNEYYTSRPTNTSVWYLIKAVNYL